jgi:hypothetical protein
MAEALCPFDQSAQSQHDYWVGEATIFKSRDGSKLQNIALAYTLWTANASRHVSLADSIVDCLLASTLGIPVFCLLHTLD